MTKDQIAQQLKQEFAKGNFKPSKIKRSKSTGDISITSPGSTPVQKSKSSENMVMVNPPAELQQQISSLQDELTIERKRVASLREDLAVQQEKLKAKNQAITSLKKQNNELEEKILALRLKNLQDFDEYYT